MAGEKTTDMLVLRLLSAKRENSLSLSSLELVSDATS